MSAAAPKLLLAAPRGYCAGVERAVQAVEKALELYGAPVYVRKEIVHNKHVVDQLRERFPNITGPRTDDICYATTNRQAAVKQLARHCDLVLVIGSRNSSNSNRLVEVAREHGAASHLIDNERQVQEEWLEGKRVVGITSGASAPEELVQRLVEFFRERGTEDVHELDVIQEDVRFMLPKSIRQALAGASA